MPAPAATTEFLTFVRRSGLIDEPTLAKFADDGRLSDDPLGCATALVKAGLLSDFQAKQLLKGRFRGFILGPYRLLRPLGQGGMGVVYLGEHSLMKRQVAVKVLPQDKAKDKLALDRFYREARSVAALDHPNIVSLHDISQGAGVHFLVMEYVEGTTLQAVLETQGPLHHGQVVGYVAQIAAGLGHAHERGFVHRDIKPANLIVTRAGQLKILDMGLARSFIDPTDELTAAGGPTEATGTADYLSPEQAMNYPADARSDIYSLGATMFTLITGKTPFDGSTAQKLLQHQIKDAPTLHHLRSAVPPALGEVVRAMMAKSPDDRYQSTDELLDALRPWLPAGDGPTSSVVVGRRLTDTELGEASSPVRRKGTTKTKKRAPAVVARSKRAWRIPAVVAGVLVAAAGVWAVAGGSKKPATAVAAADPVTPPAVVAPAFVSPAAITPAAITPAPVVPPVAKVEERFFPVPFGAAATATTARPLFYDNPAEVIVPDRWGRWTVKDVPFDLIDPRDGSVNNIILLNGSLGTQSAAAPAVAALKVRSRASAVHILGLVGGWCWPYKPDGRDAHGEVVLTVRFAYADGQTEDHQLLNGEHIADYIRETDVPGSDLAFVTTAGRQVRYLALRPKRDAVIAEIQFLKGAHAEAAPITFAVTVERPGR